jgi:hypothetical protein
MKSFAPGLTGGARSLRRAARTSIPMSQSRFHLVFDEIEFYRTLAYGRCTRTYPEISACAGRAHQGYLTVRTDVGEVRITVPRDRAGTFTPAVVPKHARRLAGFDEAVLSLYAKGMTTGDIVNHLTDIYGTEVSRELVSKVTDAVIEQMVSWQNRPLDPKYQVN